MFFASEICHTFDISQDENCDGQETLTAQDSTPKQFIEKFTSGIN